ncbi:MAG: hypothetical protein PHI73_05620, partial [Patescibacteria group bacterium]|nr:hypothetical protein [Patescibacteria group bacterium]
ATTITQGANNLTFNLDGAGEFLVQDSGANKFRVAANGDVYLPALPNCSGAQTLDTGTGGKLQCGADATGSGTSHWDITGVTLHPTSSISVLVGSTTVQALSKLEVYADAGHSAGADIALNARESGVDGRRWDIISTGSGSAVDYGIGKFIIRDVDAGGDPQTMARLTIDTAGNVGIGDTSPVSLLTVGTNDLFQVNSIGDLVKIKNVSYVWPAAQGAANTYLRNNGSGNLTWATVTGGESLWEGTQGVAINPKTPASTKVGIGFANPVSRLHVYGGQTWGSDARLDSTGLAGGRMWSLIAAGGDAGEGQGKLVFKDNSAGGTELEKDRLVIDTAGNVGIGTASPTDKLHLYNSGDTPMLIESGTGISYLTLKTPASSQSAITFNTAPGEQAGIYWEDNIPRLQIYETGSANTTTLYLQNGRLAINDETPDATLDVNGSVAIATSIFKGDGSTKFFSDCAAGQAIRVINANGTVTCQAVTDELAKVSANDTTAGYLNGKLVAGSNITLTELNNGANETLQISATGGSADNLGNHTATQNLKMSGFWVSNDGGDEGVFVKTDGNVGIGKSDPLEKLHIGGNVRADNGTYAVQLDFAGIGTGPQINLGSPSSPEIYLTLGAYGGINNLYTPTRDLKISSSTIDPIMYLKQDTGNVGIGTNAPTSQLQINKSASGAIGPNIRLRNTADAVADQAQYSFYDGADPGTLRGAINFEIAAGGKAITKFLNGVDGNVYENMRIDKDGNVGISQTAPVGRFVVNKDQSGTGSVGDAIAVYANTTNSTLYAQQNNAGGYAGSFSGYGRFSTLEPSWNSLSTLRAINESTSNTGVGILGVGGSTTTTNRGSYGVAGIGRDITAQQGRSAGVWGKGGATGSTGTTVGVWGEAGPTDAGEYSYGVYGKAGAGTGTRYGVFSYGDLGVQGNVHGASEVISMPGQPDGTTVMCSEGKYVCGVKFWDSGTGDELDRLTDIICCDL